MDVVAGSHLTELSLIGPSPAGGVRFYGIGNELEATLGALVPIAAGAALAAWMPGASKRARRAHLRARRRWWRCGLSRRAGSAPTSARRSGYRSAPRSPPPSALTRGAGDGPGSCRAADRYWRRWRRPTSLSGGDAHLTRTVLRAGGLDQLSEVLQRRLELSAHSFARYASTVILWLSLAALAIGIVVEAAHRGVVR